MKLCFLIGADGSAFLQDILPWAEKKYEVRVHSMKDSGKADSVDWADIVWCEWCTDAAAMVSHLPDLKTKVIVRLHRWEAYTDWIKAIKWQRVDRLLLVPNPYTRQQLLSLPQLFSLPRVIDLPNAINLKRFTLGKGDGRKIAYVGSLNLKKNIPFLLQCFYELLDFDDNYTLHCAGKFQDKVIENYCRHMAKVLGLESKMVFEGQQEDINKWLQDKSFIVCPSLVEGHPVAVMEGMACGLRPLIHNFPGCSEFFPPEYIFDTPLDFVNKIKGGLEPEKYRKWVENNYPFERQTGIIEEVFKELNNR